MVQEDLLRSLIKRKSPGVVESDDVDGQLLGQPLAEGSIDRYVLGIPVRKDQSESRAATAGRKVDVRLPGKGDSNSHGARPVHLIIKVIKWIR